MTDPDPDPTTTSDATHEADARDSRVHGQPDRAPTEEEERMAEAHADAAGSDVGEHFDEMAELGAEVRGEGQIEP
jgi:hypothetical protein